MSILINGMKMPKNCNECPLHFYEGQGICSCRALLAIDDDEILKPWKNKRKDCPLVPFPPHGRLIDADKLVDSFEPSDFWNHDAQDNCFAAVRIVHSAPTIIPASDKDTNVLDKEEGET